MRPGTIHLFTTIDSSWLPYACVMVKSVRLHATEPLCYWIVHDDIESDRQRLVADWGQREGIDIQFIHFPSLQTADSTGFLQSLRPLPAVMPVPTTSPGVSFGRYLPDFILGPRGVTRAIYADVDMLAVGSIAQLMTIPLGGMAIGAVLGALPDPAAQVAGLAREEYFSNGLFVLDIDRFNGASCVARLDATVRVGGLVFGTQCAFSKTLRGSICTLDNKWNVQMEFRSTVGGDARLIHFTGPMKPWHCLSVDPLRKEVRRILKTTPFPSAWNVDGTPRTRLRGVARRWKRVFQTMRAPEREWFRA